VSRAAASEDRRLSLREWILEALAAAVGSTRHHEEEGGSFGDAAAFGTEAWTVVDVPAAAARETVRAFAFYGDPLPPMPAELVEPSGSRRDTAEALAAALEDASRPVVCLAGPSGMGKTTMVLDTVNRRSAEPGGPPFCLWIDCQRHAAERSTLSLPVGEHLLDALPHLRNGDPLPLPAPAVATSRGLLVFDGYQELLKRDGTYDADPWIPGLIRECVRQAGAGAGAMKILLLSWHPPLHLDPQGNDPVLTIALDEHLTTTQMRRLLKAVDQRTVEGRALQEATRLQRESLLEACCGNPAALNAALAALRMRQYASVEDLLAEPFLVRLRTSGGKPTNLHRFVHQTIEHAAAEPHAQAALFALALLRVALPVEGDDAEAEGILRVSNAVLAALGEPPTTARQLRRQLDRMSPGPVVREKHDRTGRFLYSLSPLFAWSVEERLRALGPKVRAALSREVASFFEGLLDRLAELMRQGASHARGGSLIASYRMETPEYRRYVGEWLRATLSDPQRDPARVSLAIAGVVLQLHWWWAVFVRWEVLEDVLESVDTNLRIAERLQPAADFSAEFEILRRLREFVRAFPPQSEWWREPSPAECRLARQHLTAIRRALGCDSFEDSEPLRGALRAAGAITDTYLGDTHLQELRAGGAAGNGELAAEAKRSARARFAPASGAPPDEAEAEDMRWSVLYVIADQCEVELARGRRQEALAFAAEGLELCRLSDERDRRRWSGRGGEDDEAGQERDAKWELYQNLGAGLLDVDPELALRCMRVGQWEAFAYLWDPPTDPPNDDYTLTLYRTACDQFAHALREVYARPGPEMQALALRVCRETRRLWREGLAAPDEQAPADDARLGGLLSGWTGTDRARLGASGTKEREAYAHLTAALFPAPPQEPDDREYAEVAEEMTRRTAPAAWALRDEVNGAVRRLAAETH
jgi:hypothetical protein